MIRRARKSDVPAVAELERTCFTRYQLSRKRLHYLRRRPTVVFYVAELRGRVVGEVICLLRRNQNSTSARIYSLAVDPACRGRRLGRRLLARLLRSIASRRVRRVGLEVEQSNTPAIHLYQDIGFRIVRRLPGYYGRGRPGVRMVRETAGR